MMMEYQQQNIKDIIKFKSLKYTVVANLPEFIKMTPQKASENN